jgi:hypothetical protein
MKPVAVLLVGLVGLACSDPGPNEPGSGGAGSSAGGMPAGGAQTGGVAGSNATGGTNGGSSTGGQSGASQGGSPGASKGQIRLGIADIQDYGDGKSPPLDGLDAAEFCGDVADAASLKPEGTLMRSPGTGRYFVCLGPLSVSSSVALLDVEPGAPRVGYELYAALFHFDDAEHPNPNPGGKGPENFGLVILELNDFNGRSQCVSSNATFTGFKDVGVQKLLGGDSACSTGSAKYLQDDKRWIQLQVGASALTFELERVASGS